MKLLVVIGTVNFNGGAHFATWAMIDALRARGVEVDILTGNEPNAAMKKRLAGGRVLVMEDPFPRRGVRYLVQGVCRRLKIGWVPNWTIDPGGKWRRKAAEYDTVLVIGEDSHYRNLIGSVKGPWKVVFIHTDYAVWRTAVVWARVDTRCDWWTYRKFDQIGVVGCPNAARFAALFPQFKDKVCVFHNLFDLKRGAWRHEACAAKFRFVTISRLVCGSPKKTERYVRVAARLKAMGLNFEWQAWGDGAVDEVARLKAYVDELGVGDVFRLMGFTKDPQREIVRADAMLLLSDFEGMSNAIYESLLCGTPVVTTDVGGAAEQVEDGVTGRVVANDEDAIVAALSEILAKRGLVDGWRKNLVGYRYDNEKVIEEYLNILQVKDGNE